MDKKAIKIRLENVIAMTNANDEWGAWSNLNDSQKDALRSIATDALEYIRKCEKYVPLDILMGISVTE